MNPKKILWISFSEWRGYWFTPLGIYTLVGFIQKRFENKFDHELWYYDQNQIQLLVGHIQADPPKYICVSVNIGYISHATEFFEQLYLLVPNSNKIEIIFGNREFLNYNNVARIFDKFPASLIVKGDGEEALSSLLSEEKKENIPNLYYKSGGPIVYTFDKTLDARDYAAPVYTLKIINDIQIKPNEKVGYVEVSRGCNKKSACTFCSNSINSKLKKWRILNHDEILTSIINVSAYKPTVINFVSEDFLGGYNKSIELLLNKLQVMRQNGTLNPSINFYCAIRTSDVFSKADSAEESRKKTEILKFMKELGFTTLYVGFESGCDNQLKRYNKGISAQENKQAVKILRNIGFHIDGGFIMFDPLMKIEDCYENISFLRRVKIPKLTLFPFNHLIIFPQTNYYRLYQKKKADVDKKVSYLLKVIQEIDRHIPYKLFELLLQILRLHYFSNDNKQKIEFYENIIHQYGNISLNYIEELTLKIQNNSPPDAINSLNMEFIKNQNSFALDLCECLRKQEKAIFEQYIPSIKHFRGI